MTTESEILDYSLPPTEVLALLGTINLAWSLFDARITAALFSLLNIDELELALLLGRMESQKKLDRIEGLLSHRKQPVEYVQSLKRKLHRLRPDRNALTHGVYQGKTKKGEYVFQLLADPLIESGHPTAYQMRVFLWQTIFEHGNEIIETANDLATHFDAEKMAQIYRAPLRVPQHLRVDPNRSG